MTGDLGNETVSASPPLSHAAQGEVMLPAHVDPPGRRRTPSSERVAGALGAFAVILALVITMAVAAAQPGVSDLRSSTGKHSTLVIRVGDTPLIDLRTGDCLDGALEDWAAPDATADDDGGSASPVTLIETVEVTSCDVEHQAEVFDRFTEPADNLDFADGVPTASLEECNSRFEDRVGEAWTGLDVDVVLTLTESFGGDVVILCYVASLADGGLDRPLAEMAPDPGFVHLRSLAVGDCFDRSSERWSAGFIRRSCDVPHVGEVYAVVRLPGGTPPAPGQVVDWIVDACRERFDALDDVPAGVSWDSLSPTVVAWMLGDPQACFLVDASGGALDTDLLGGG